MRNAAAKKHAGIESTRPVIHATDSACIGSTAKTTPASADETRPSPAARRAMAAHEQGVDRVEARC